MFSVNYLIYMHFTRANSICIFNFLFALLNCGAPILKYWSVFVPYHTFTNNRTLCIHSHREVVAPAIRKLREASSQLSWDVNLHMGSQNTFTQIEPFLFATYNGWGSRCPTSPAWTIVGKNLGAFRVIYPKNKCSDPKPTLDRVIPDCKNYP